VAGSRAGRHQQQEQQQQQHMTETLSDQQMGTVARGQAHAPFAPTMGYVTVAAALFAAGASLGRGLTGGVGIVAFIAAFAALFGMRFAARRSAQLAVGLLGCWARSAC
jgi:hypothetical protein